MLKQAITYDDYNGNSRTEDFYFNFTKLEIMEQDLDMGGFEETVRLLTETEDARKAYYLFKKLVLASYGVKSDDGKRFIKSTELRESFEQSPACAELIISFLQDATLGAKFVEAVLPAKLVAAAKEDPNQPPLDFDPKGKSREELIEAMHNRQIVRPVEDVQLPEEAPAGTERNAAAQPDFQTMTPQEFREWKDAQS